MIGSEKIWARGAALTSRLQSFETELLTQEENPQGLAAINREADCLAAKLRPGNVHSAEGCEELLLPEIERQQKLGKEVVIRADAAFGSPGIYEALEKRDVKYAIRIPANDTLMRDIAELLTRPVERPSHRLVVWHKSFLY